MSELALPVSDAVELLPDQASALALVAERFGSDAWKKIDEIETQLEKLTPQEMPQNHVFTPGLYIREVWLPAGTLLTSRIHLTEHPFIISMGSVAVWDDDRGWVVLHAPHTAITRPATRRILYAITDVIWSTAHANPANETDPDKIVREITFTGGKFAALGAAANRAILTEGVSQ